MTVDGYLELYTTLFGWEQYNHLWDLLVSTGVVYLPFLGMILRNFMEPYQSQEAGDASSTSVRRMEVDIVVALSVVVLAGQPFIPLSPEILKYNRPCTAETATPGVSGTSFDQSFGAVVSTATSDVPIWWFAVLAFSGGSTQAAISTIGCDADFSGHIRAVKTSQINDPALVQEIYKFVRYCWVPARSKFQADPNVTIVTEEAKNQVQHETEWIGSQIFLDLPGYYDALRPKEPITGWPYDPARDTEYPNPLPPGYDPDNSGRPTCKEWWSDPTRGLRQKLVANVPSSLWDRAFNTLSEFTGIGGYGQTDMENDTLRNLLANTIAVSPADVAGGFNGPGIPWLGSPALEAAALGAFLEALSFWPMVEALKAALPMIQALILMGVYMLLPFVVVFSGYTLEMVVAAAIALFTLKFWSFLWVVASWIDNHLVQALFPDPTLFYFLSPSATPGATLKRMLLAMLAALLFIGLPLVWTAMMGWVGIRVSSTIDSIAGQISKPTQDAGRKGGDTAKTVGQTVLTRKLSR